MGMITRVGIIGISLGAVVCLVLPAQAAKRQHRPWFSHSERSSSIPAESSPDTITSPIVPRNDEKVSPSPVDDVGNAQTYGDEKGERVVSRALHYKGTRYKFGGTSKRGVDCSGLVTRVWEDLKLKKIPRASSALYSTGKPIHLAELRPGDLVFFKNTYRHGISHVGVYTGNNKFVHAAGRSKGVTITKLSDPYYQLHYAGARRLY